VQHARPGAWWLKLSVAIITPFLVLTVLELLLRLFGAGYNPHFLLTETHHGKQFLVHNPRFGWRFFGRQMSRSPHAIFIPKEKPAGTIRVIVMGESAAFGDPQPAFGLPRMTEALLELRHPGTRFEVINAAMTGINSHVIRDIASDCRVAGADAWLVYMGNNEVVGPFGAGTVFGGRALPLPFIRLSLWAKSLRIGQVLQAFVHKRQQQEEWGGMTMFLKQQVPQYDQRMKRVYDSFTANLRKITDIGVSHGSGVVLCTLSSNLKDCPPFASTHGPSFSTADQSKWQSLRASGLQARREKRTSDADAIFKELLAMDDLYAESAFLAAETKPENDATGLYKRARDLDTLRFRCDSALNEKIQKQANDSRGGRILLADVNAALTQNEEIPGDRQFYDHVHLTFAGNYAAARAAVEKIEQLLADSGKLPRSAEIDWPALEACASRLGWGEFAERAALMEMLPRLTDPPFTGQLDHFDKIQRVQSRILQLSAALAPARIQQQLNSCLEAARAFPDDPDLRIEISSLASAAGQTNEAVSAAIKATELIPNSTEAWGHLGLAREKAGDLAGAAQAYKKLGLLDPDAYSAFNHSGRVLAAMGKDDAAEKAFRRAVSIKPRFGPGWLALGQLLEKRGDTAGANASYGQAMKNPMRSVPDLVRLANYCREHGLPLAAATNMAEAVTLNPTDPAAYLRAGQDFEAAGMRDRALDYFAQATRIAPSSAPAHFLLGRELGLAGKLNGAEKEFREASRLMPDLAEARINLAVTLAKQNRTEEAIAEYEAITARWPTNTTARQNLEALRKVRNR
jgi:tetratricopeptide (TPR) repeat protein